MLDQPPLLPFLVRISRMVLGDSLRSIRFLPALATSIVVVLTAMIAREFGGRGFVSQHQCRSRSDCSHLSFRWQPAHDKLSEPLLWMGCVYFAILAIKRDARYWLWFGVVAGLGLEESIRLRCSVWPGRPERTLTKQRSVLLNKWFWMAGVAAFLILLPNLLRNIPTTGRSCN